MTDTRSDVDDDVMVIDQDDLTDYNEDHILPVSPEAMEKILGWLEPTAFDAEGSEFRKHLQSHLDGTGKWLFSASTYRQWHESPDQGMLWIKGIPGSGKSVSAASLVRRFQAEDVPVLYFFFRQIIDANHKPAAVLRDWLAQVLRFSPPLQVKLQKHISDGRRLDSLSLADLLKHLRLALVHLPKVYCVADALDEMDKGNDEFLQALAELGRWRPSQVKILVTSRPVASVETPLRPFKILQLRLNESLVDRDIEVYVRHRLENSKVAREDRESIKQAVPGRANGLFLYAKLAMDSFLEPGASMHRVLQSLPSDLNTMYTDLLREHTRRSTVPAEAQVQILQWVTHATRPLRLLEIAEVINATSFKSGELKSAKDLVRAACGPLLEILPDETVCPVHHSLTEFLIGSTRISRGVDESLSEFPILKAGSTHRQLAQTCLEYLQAGPFSAPGSTSHDGSLSRDKSRKPFAPQAKSEELKIQYPFLDYAASNWFVHVARSDAGGADQSGLNTSVDSFLRHRTIEGWLGSTKRFLEAHWPCSLANGITPLHVAAMCGLTTYCRHLVSAGAEIDPQDNEKQSPLFLASHNGHDEIVRLLLEHGAKPNDHNSFGLRPLHVAATSNNPRVVSLLLRAGVDPLTPTVNTFKHRPGKAPTSDGKTALMYACNSGYVEVVDALLPFIKDIGVVHRSLAWATLMARYRVVERILRHPGVDVNASVDGDTPLFNACKCADPKTIEVLLRAGADPNAFSRFDQYKLIDMGDRGSPPPESRAQNRGFTALHALAGCVFIHHYRLHGDDQVAALRALLDAGANVHQRSPDGQTALHYTCTVYIRESGFGREISPIAARLLIDAGADVHATRDNGNTPLHECAGGLLNTARVLVEHGANINFRGRFGRTPLFGLVDPRHDCSTETLRKFLELRPDCNAIDDHGDGILHLALRRSTSDLAFIRTLLQAGADPNLRNRKGQTPLHWLQVGSEPTLDVLKLLIESGADIEARDHEGRTVLHENIATWFPVAGVTGPSLLLNFNAKLDTRDVKGRSLLHEAASQWNLKGLSFLVDGVDPKVVDYRGNTIWHEAMVKAHSYDNREEFLNWLVKLQVDPAQANNDGQTPLHLLCSRESPRRRAAVIDDFIIQTTKSVHRVDHHGATPLHIAATLSEIYTGKLLEAGANPAQPTFDGLTPLHIACQARQSNIVGMLLEALRSAAHAQGSAVSTFLEAKDESGRTPLHHACRSGRPETVIMLLEAGANVNAVDKENRTPLLACREFEEEQALWGAYYDPEACLGVLAAGSTRLVDKSRTQILDEDSRPARKTTRLETEQDCVRLEEIFDMLLAHGAKAHLTDADGRESLFSSYSECIENQHDYTAECFQRLNDKLYPGMPFSRGIASLISESRRKSFSRALQENEAEGCILAHQKEPILQQLLAERQYSLFVRFCRRWDFALIPNENGKTILHVLAIRGLSRLLREVGSTDAAHKIDDTEWRESWENTSEASQLHTCYRGSIKSLLWAALDRELPNMDVVKLLVEEFGVDINTTDTSCDTALHLAATGRSWWHATQAVPYLVEHGAKLEARDASGSTPLLAALNELAIGRGNSSRAAQELIKLGADVNAVDSGGQSCLAMAPDNLEMVKFLILHGAKVTESAIFATINAQNVDALEFLMSNIADQDLGHYSARAPGLLPFYHGVQDAERNPLHFAAMEPSGNWHPLKRHFKGSAKSKEKFGALVRVLLRHGADPFAACTVAPLEVDWNTVPSPQPQVTEQRTVLHSVLSSSFILEPFLEHPNLDLERRDKQGRTLLLAACSGRRGPDFRLTFPNGSLCSPRTTTILQFFMDRGADLLARDNKGRNLVHSIISRSDNSDVESLRLVLSKAPELLCQRDVHGDTPFHYAMSRIRAVPDIAKMLLDVGATPLELDSKGNTPLHSLAPWFLRADPVQTHAHIHATWLFGPDAVPEPQKPQTEASRIGRVEFFELLLRRGVHIDEPNPKTGNTPLFALMSDCYLEQGNPFVSRLPFSPSTPRKYSSRPGHVSTNQPDALSDLEKEAFQLFEKAGANFFARNNEGATLLHVVARLPVYSAKLDSKPEESHAAMAARFKYLLERGLDPMTEDNRQQTALDVAAATGNQHILQLFERQV